MNGDSFYNNWSESNYDDSRAAAINVRQSKWTSEKIEEEMGYMCIYRLFSKYLLNFFSVISSRFLSSNSLFVCILLIASKWYETTPV